MISKHLTILPAVAALLLGAGCSNDDMDGILADGPVAAQVTADISDGQTVTRVSTDGDTPAFADGDVIYVVADGTDTYEYTLSGGTWSADTPYYFQDLNAVYFRGWYADPAVAETENTTDNTISIDTSTQTTDENGWNEWDILATPEVPAYAASPTINFTGDNAFTHVMSQVTLTFKAGNGVSSLENLTGYTLTDLITDATFNTLTCALTAGTTIGDITQDIEASGTEYTCPSVILVPQDVTDGKLSLEATYNGLTYTADLTLPESATAMAAGTHYTFNVTLSNTGLTVSSAAIANWTAATGSGSATIKPNYTYTEENGIRTYTVYDEAGLNAWSEYTRNSHWATNCTLAADITLSTVESGSNWTAVGNSSNSYTGTFDGNGHTITNLTIISDRFQGLIGWLGSGGVVKNLTLENVNISVSEWFIGAVVGWNEGTVTNCSVSGSVSGSTETGGVVGENYGGTVTACYATGQVIGGYYTGGVVGVNAKGTVTACYSTGEVSGSTETGGVVGSNAYDCTVIACYFAGSVSMSVSDGYYTGGVVGWNSGSLSTCYWTNSSEDTGAAEYGIGSTSSNDNATKVDDVVTWATAKDAMNEALTGSGWQYTGDGTSDPPLTLVAE